MLDICCVSFNTLPKLQRFLEYLHEDDNLQWKLYIADNGSTDGSVEYLKNNVDKYRIEALHLNENIGYSAACNQLASLGTSKIVGLFNADTWMRSKEVEKIVNSFAIHPEMAIMGPKQRDELGRIRHAGIVGTHKKPEHRGWSLSDPSDQAFRDYIQCFTVSGSVYLVRRTVWDVLTECPIFQTVNPGAIGAFLSTPHFYEETWASVHAQAHGYEVYYDGSISMGHSWHASSPIGSQDNNFSISRNKFIAACNAHNIPHEWP